MIDLIIISNKKLQKVHRFYKSNHFFSDYINNNLNEFT